MSNPTTPLTVYYDGLCRVCSAEIDHYRKRDTQNLFRWVDISDPHFKSEAENLDPIEIQRKFHARDSSGKLYVGVPAFIEIWKRIPGFQSWAKLAQTPPARVALTAGYEIFMRVRPYLPRKKQKECTDGYCQLD